MFKYIYFTNKFRGIKAKRQERLVISKTLSGDQIKKMPKWKSKQLIKSSYLRTKTFPRYSHNLQKINFQNIKSVIKKRAQKVSVHFLQVQNFTHEFLD